jgi:ubiquinone biosynthesis protein UbiJ
VNPVTSATGQFLELIANQALRLDPLAKSRLAALDGRLIQIECTAPAETLWLAIRDADLKVQTTSTDPPTVVLKGPAPALAGAMMGAPGATRDLDIEGDETTLEELREILVGLRPDLAEWLSPLIGQQAADGIASLTEVGMASLRSLAEGLSGEGSRIAKDAAGRRFVDQIAFDELQAASQQLNLAVDRVTRRIELLEQSRS